MLSNCHLTNVMAFAFTLTQLLKLLSHSHNQSHRFTYDFSSLFFSLVLFLDFFYLLDSDAINARLAKHRGSVHNLQLDIMDGIVQVGKI